MANEALKPCPFCGSSPRVARRSGVTGVACRSRYYRETVVCKCGASSKEHKAPGRAVEHWNRRPTLSSDAVAGGEPAYWAVHTSTGVHVGLWSDKATAEKVVSEYPNGTLTALYAAPPELDQLRDRVKELEKALSDLRNTSNAIAPAAKVTDKMVYAFIDSVSRMVSNRGGLVKISNRNLVSIDGAFVPVAVLRAALTAAQESN